MGRRLKILRDRDLSILKVACPQAKPPNKENGVGPVKAILSVVKIEIMVNLKFIFSW